MLRACYCAGIAGALAWTSPVLAQSDDQRTGSDGRAIVVTGQAPEEPPTHREVTRQARDITAPTGILHAPLPRFEGDRLCPGVFGLKADYASLMIDRIRANAERFDLWMTEDDGTCAPNFIVAFVDDGQAVLQQIEEGQYWLFSDMPRFERIALLAEDGPAHVWTTTEARTAGGMPLPLREDGRKASAMSSGGVARAALPVREDITGVLVLFDRDDVRNLTLVQLADYATMRGLARTRPIDADGAPLDTILALFDTRAEPPSELTAFDGAYLGALYRGGANVPGMSKVQGVNREMQRQAAAEQGATGGAEASSRE